MTAKVQVLPDPLGSNLELDALVLNLKDVVKRVFKLMPELPKEASTLIDSVTEPGQIADLITSNLDVQVGRKAGDLEIFDLKARLRRVLQFLSRQHEVLKVREKINTQVQEEMGRNQREYVLRQQLRPSRRSWARSTRQAGTWTTSGRRSRQPRCPARPRRWRSSSWNVLRSCSRHRLSTR